MTKTDYFWVEFNGMRIRARNKSEAFAIVLKKFEEGDYPEIYIEQEFVGSLQTSQVHGENCDME
jgi:hypothetical protein